MAILFNIVQTGKTKLVSESGSEIALLHDMLYDKRIYKNDRAN